MEKHIMILAIGYVVMTRRSVKLDMRMKALRVMDTKRSTKMMVAHHHHLNLFSKETEAEVCLKVSLFEVPRVLVTCRRRKIDDENDDDENVPLYYHINKDFSIPIGREEFCLVTGLRFGVQNWAEYDIKERILQLVILGVESRHVFPDWMLRLANDKGNMPVVRLTPDDNEARSDWWISSEAYFDGFIGQVERVPFDLSRQNMYEIPSDIYREFDERKKEIERNKKEADNIKEEMRKFRHEMNVQP
ncbi:hypothetical protein Tco_1296904, partial [Tanacetum coccineum]